MKLITCKTILKLISNSEIKYRKGGFMMKTKLFRSRGLRNVLATLIAVIMATSLIGCGNAAESLDSNGSIAETAKVSTVESTEGNSMNSRDSISLALPSDYANMAPNGMATAAGRMVNVNLYSTLFYTSAEGERILDAATSVKQEDDTHIIVQIRDDIVDQAGNTLTASDVLFSFKLARDGSTAFPTYVTNIDFDNCEVVDDITLRIALLESSALSLPLIGQVYLVTEAGYNSSSDGMITDVVATGAYKVESFVSGSSVTLIPNENYYGEEPAIKKANYIVISETSQVVNSLVNNDIQVGTISASDYDYINSQDDTYAFKAVGGTMWSLFMNCGEGKLLEKKEERQAIGYAINKDAIIAAALNGIGEKANGPFPVVCIEKNNYWDEVGKAHDNYYDFNQDKARELADASGLVGQTIRLIYTNSQPIEKIMAEQVQAQLQMIGITAIIDVYDDAVYNDTIQNSTDWDICFQPYGNAAMSAIGAMNTFAVTMNQVHLYGDMQEEFNSMVNDALNTVDEAERIEKTNAIEEYVTEENFIYAIAPSTTLYGVEKGLHVELVNSAWLRLQMLYYE